MKQSIKLLFLLLVTMLSAMSCTTQPLTPEEELELIRERYVESLESIAPTQEIVAQYIKDIDLESGAWRDLDYMDQSGSGWKSTIHAERTGDMAAFYSRHKEDQEQFTHAELSKAIHAAWKYWFDHKPVCKTNWWPNDIGVPKPMGRSFLLLQDEMSEDESQSAKEVVFPKTVMKRTGTNLLWESDIVLTRALFLGDIELAHEAIKNIASLVCVVERGIEGIQKDNSFHQHGPQQQFGNYGMAMLETGYSVYCPLLAGTSFAFSEEVIDVVVDLICDGYGWVMWNGALDVNSTGRFFSQGVQEEKGNAILAAVYRFLPACNDEQKARVQQFIDDNTTGKREMLGQKSFYCSDGMYHHTPTWAASLKMSSMRCDGDGSDVGIYAPDAFVAPTAWRAIKTYNARVVGTEQGDDHLKGYYFADGALYTYVDGDDYENCAAVWDWRKVPGITCYESTEPIQRYKGLIPPTQSSYVGTCTDKKSGITSMILNRDSLMAHKSWVVTDDFVLCLGSGVRDYLGKATLTTTIDQKIAKGDLLYLNGGSWESVDKKVASEKNMRFYHYKSGYIVLDGSEAEGSIAMREGDWEEVSLGYDPQVDRKDVFTLFVRHRKQNDSYKYLILPARTKEEVALFDVAAIDVIQNDTKAVIVKYKDTYYISAFETGSYQANDLKFEATIPGLFMLKPSGDSWSVEGHDPTQRVTDDEFVKSLQLL